MRESFRERREHLHRGLRTPGLTTMLLMLAILGLIFVQLRNANNWRMFGAGDDDKQVPSQPTAARTTATGPASTANPAKARTTNSEPNGPTDLDSEEMKQIQPLLSIVTDGSTESQKFDQPAYFQILSWVDHQSTEALRKRATRAFFYDTLIKSPDTMRLQIVDVKLAVRQVVPVMGKPKDGKPQPLLTRDGKEIYEVRGVSPESGSNLYFGMVTDLPPGTQIGTLINEDARLIGYFFKVQGYISQQQQFDFEETRRKVVPLKAPLIIGRLVWLTPPGTTTAADNTPVWVLASAGGIGIILIVGWVIWSSRRKRPSPMPWTTTTSLLDPDAPEVDSWLDQAQSGRFSLDPIPETAAHFDRFAGDLGGLSFGLGDRFPSNILGDRNIFGDNGESTMGDRSKNGNSSNEGNHYKNGASGHEPEVRENDNPNN